MENVITKESTTGSKVYLDGKVACILMGTNGVLSTISNGEEFLVVFNFRLKTEKL